MEVQDFKIYRANIKMIDEFVTLNFGEFYEEKTIPKNFCGKNNISKEQYHKLFNRSNVHIYGLWYRQKLIASAVIVLKEHKHKVGLINFLLHPVHGGITIGMAMLSGIENVCAALGYTTMYVACNANNDEAYTCFVKRAFFTASYVVDPNGDYLRMQKLLTKKDVFTINKINQAILRG